MMTMMMTKTMMVMITMTMVMMTMTMVLPSLNDDVQSESNQRLGTERVDNAALVFNANLFIMIRIRRGREKVMAMVFNILMRVTPLMVMVIVISYADGNDGVDGDDDLYL